MRTEIRILKSETYEGNPIYLPVEVVLDDKGVIVGYSKDPYEFYADTKHELIMDIGNFLNHAETRPVVNERKLCEHLKIPFDPIVNNPTEHAAQLVLELINDLDNANNDSYYDQDIVEMQDAISDYFLNMDLLMSDTNIKNEKIRTKLIKKLLDETKAHLGDILNTGNK